MIQRSPSDAFLRPLVAAALVVLGACAPVNRSSSEAPGAGSAPNVVSDADRAAGWRSLFDGRAATGWRAYRGTELPAGWQVVDGTLTRVAQGGDIVTVDEYENFDLVLDWKVEPGGNSGVFYRATEATESIYENAPEMQVLDDARHRDGQSPLTSAGSVYGLYPAPRGVEKPAGEWTTARVLVNGNHVEHWLNGTRVASYELGSADWAARVAAAKFKDWPSYGKAARGRIGLQDHGDRVAYRNIRVRVLP